MSTGTIDQNPPGTFTADAGGGASTTLVAFTWNVHKNAAALDLACQHLKGQGPFIACLQELPKEADRAFLLTKVTGEHKLKVLSRGALRPVNDDRLLSLVDSTIILISSDDIEIDWIEKNHEYHPELDDKRRLEGFTLRSPQWRKLQVMGVHGWDRINHRSDYERADWGKIMRDVLDNFWDNGPLVFMGDLNANPWSPEVTRRSYLHAIRRKDFPLRGDERKQEGKERYVEPLYNPMWQIIPDRASGAHGTLSYEDEHDLRWHCFDQIIVSRDLADHCGMPEVLTSLLGCKLINDNGTPLPKGKSYEWSQHLPVQMKIDLGKVEPCRP